MGKAFDVRGALTSNGYIIVNFRRACGGAKPVPMKIAQRGRELDEHGNEMNIRRSTSATDVDGLQPEHEYTITLDLEALRRGRWAPVSKDEFLVDHYGKGSDIQDYRWESTPLDFRVTGTVLNVLD